MNDNKLKPQIIIPPLLVAIGFLCSYIDFKTRTLPDQPNLLYDIAPSLQILQATDIFNITNIETHKTIYALDFTLCFAMLFGLFIYFISKGSSFRFLAFCLSVLFIAILSNLIFSVAMPFTQQEIFDYKIMKYKPSSIQIIAQLFWIGLLAYTLLFMNKLRKFTYAENTTGAIKVNETYYMMLDRSKRATFTIFDVFIGIILCGKIVMVFIGEWINKLEHIVSPSIPVFMLFMLSFIIYNIIFEFIFSSTPCMYLGQAKIMNINGNKINFISILKRSFEKLFPWSKPADTQQPIAKNISIVVVKENNYSSYG